MIQNSNTMENELPKGWESRSFIDVFDIQGGTQPPKSQFKDLPEEGYIRLLQIRDFGNKPVPTYIPNTGKWNTCKSDDILIARYGASIGRIVTGQEGAYNVALAKVTIPDYVDKRYALWLLKSHMFQNFITSFQRTAQSGFNKLDLKSIFLPIAPLPEQERIVSKLDSNFAHLEVAKQGLEKIPVLLKEFRQAVLTQAVTGKLTEEWREGKELGKWEKTTLENLVLEKPRNGFSPRGVDFETDLKSLSLSATTSGKFDSTKVKYLDIERPDTSSHLWLREGDILIQRSNSLEYVGTSAIYDGKDLEFIYPDIMIKIRVNELVLNKYLYYVLSSKDSMDYFKNNSTGTAGNMPKINQTTIMNLSLSLPVLPEQTEIVRRVEALFSKADAIEAHYKKLKEQIDQLPQAVLAKAFRGEV